MASSKPAKRKRRWRCVPTCEWVAVHHSLWQWQIIQPFQFHSLPPLLFPTRFTESCYWSGRQAGLDLTSRCFLSAAPSLERIILPLLDPREKTVSPFLRLILAEKKLTEASLCPLGLRGSAFWRAMLLEEIIPDSYIFKGMLWPEQHLSRREVSEGFEVSLTLRTALTSSERIRTLW